MKTCDGKSEGKTSIHCPKIMITKYLCWPYPLEKKFKILNFKFLYNNCMFPDF